MIFRLPFIAAALALVLALLGVGWRIHVKADAAGYDRAMGKAAADAVVASEKRRMDEKALSIKSQEIDRDHQRKKADLAVRDAARDDRLREYQAALDRRASQDSSTASRIDDATATIAGQCAPALAAVDRHAQRTALQLASLQRWVERMCVTPEK
jgi:hypothetical protein